jgi:Lar family restriction alleviation protein
MKEPKLKPCPFCHEREAAPIAIIEKVYVVLCGACFCQGPIGENEDEAVASWNRRARGTK